MGVRSWCGKASWEQVHTCVHRHTQVYTEHIQGTRAHLRCSQLTPSMHTYHTEYTLTAHTQHMHRCSQTEHFQMPTTMQEGHTGSAHTDLEGAKTYLEYV